ncbi:MAG: hypothetical protein ACPIOQ_67725, partial [Promethearchaeia archaeon]
PAAPGSALKHDKDPMRLCQRPSCPRGTLEFFGLRAQGLPAAAPGASCEAAAPPGGLLCVTAPCDSIPEWILFLGDVMVTVTTRCRADPGWKPAVGGTVAEPFAVRRD